MLLLCYMILSVLELSRAFFVIYDCDNYHTSSILTERVCTKEGKDIFIVKRKKREGMWVHRWTIEKRIY